MDNKQRARLKAEADRLLKNSGFEDIEQPDGNLKRWHSRDFQFFYTPDQFKIKQAYFQLAGQLLHEYKFANDQEKTVWWLHSEGKSYREIMIVLKDRKMTSHADFVTKTIKKLKKEMLEKCRK